jgi:hypothetical protein
MLNKLRDCQDILEGEHSVTGILMGALYNIFNSANYDHKRMVEKLEKYHPQLKGWVKVGDYMRNLEDIYNFHQSEETQERLF